MNLYMWMKSYNRWIVIFAFLALACDAHTGPVTVWSMSFNGNGDGSLTGNGTESPTQHQEKTSIEGSFTGVTLADGDSLTVSGTVSFSTAAVGSQFRFGLFDNTAKKGYFAEASNSGENSALTYATTDSPHFFGTAGSQDFSNGPNDPGGNVAAGTDYTFIFSLTRSGADIEVVSSLVGTGYSSTVSETTLGETGMGKHYTFDTVAFLVGGGAANGTIASYSNVSVTHQNNSDSDSDGMPDTYENTYGLNPAVDDANENLDNDGLSNIQEYQGADGIPGTGDETLPNDADSDDDDVNDGPELINGTDPLNPDSDFDGLDDGVETNTATFVDANNTGTDPLNNDTDNDGDPDGLEVSNGTDPHDPGSNTKLVRLLGIDFNRNDSYAAPCQSLFRVISGSTNQANNTSSTSKVIGNHTVTISQPGSEALEFRGANGDSSRAIPGGDTSVSFLVADFVATRKGALSLMISNLPSGNYQFKSWHLDTFTQNTLGFAQGASTAVPNMVQARIGGALMGTVTPTALGSMGLGTTFINDAQIPTLEFAFSHDGNSTLVIELTSTQPNGSDNHLLINGFELLKSNP